MVLQSRSGNLYFEPCDKQPRFLERVYSELALRSLNSDDRDIINENEVTLSTNKSMRLYQYFSKKENIFAQVFVNKDRENVWIQKIRPNMNNCEILGVKNQKKPVTIRIEPMEERALIVQQVNGRDFQFIGGEGDYMIEPANRT